MKVGKKLLSVFLAVIMIMSSMSVCFGSITFASALSDETVISELAEALKANDTVKNLSKYWTVANTNNGKSGKNLEYYNTVTITLPTYSMYKDMVNVMQKLDAAVRKTEKYTKYGEFGDTGSQSQCANAGEIADEISNALIDSIDMGQSEYTAHNVKAFFDRVFSMTNAINHDNNVTKEANCPAYIHDTTIIKTDDYQGYLAVVGKESAVPSTIQLGLKYFMKMGRYSYKTGGVFGIGATSHFHHAFKINSVQDMELTYAENNNTAVKPKLNEYVNYVNSVKNTTFDELLAKVNAGTMNAFLKEISDKKDAITTYVGGASTYEKLFAGYIPAMNELVASANTAIDFQNYLPIVDLYKAFIAANPSYGQFTWGEGGGANNWGAFGEKGSATHAKMEADYLTFKGYYDSIVKGGTKVLDYFVANGDLDMQYLYNFTDNHDVYYLNDSRNAADAFYNTYKDTFKDYTTEEQTVLYSQVTGFVDAIPNYHSNVGGGELQVINAIYNEGYVYLLDLQEDLKVEINPNVLYFAENAHKSYADLKTASVWSKIAEADENRAGLTAFYNTLTSSRRDQLLGSIRTSADEMIAGLYKLLGDRFTAEVNDAYAVYTAMGKPKELDVEKFLKLNAVLVSIEADILSSLDGRGQGGYISAETRAKYDEMKVDIIPVCDNFRTTYGFTKYQQYEMTYEDRKPYENDEVKVGYDSVTEAEMNNLIEALDKILNSDLIGDLLGSAEGEEFGLGTMLSDLLKGLLFKDGTINAMVKMLYPLVATKFDDVWAGLPQSITYSGINVNVNYAKKLQNVFDETGLWAYPQLMAKSLSSSKYAENIEMLTLAKNNWESAFICNEDGTLKLTWGVDAKREELEADGEFSAEDSAAFDTFFYQAFEDAFTGLYPLLAALVKNETWKPVQVEELAKGTATILGTPINLSVALQLGATANSGYANLIVPIFETLGLRVGDFETVSNVESSSSIGFIFKSILNPLFTFLETDLNDKPIDTILGILPNVIYALAFNMVPSLLNMLKTTVTYSASANLVGEVMADGVAIIVGDMLITDDEGALLPRSMFNGGLKTILANFGIDIPEIDQAKLATMGTLDTFTSSRKEFNYTPKSSGQAYTIIADKADVGYYLLSYILGAVKDEAAFTALLGTFMTQKDADGNPVLDAAGNKIPDEEALAGVKKVVYETLNLDAIDVGDAIAAIVELANQVEYGVDPYYWYAGENNSPVGTAAADIYLNPGNDWTEAKAEYLYNNLEALLTSIFGLAKLDLDKSTTKIDGSIEGALGEALGGLFSNKTVTGLAKLLGSLSDLGALLAPKAEEGTPEGQAEGEEAGLDIAEILTDLLKNELGIDLSVYAQYANLAEDAEIDFGVTDAASFVDALTELLTPLKPVLDFVLGGEDLTLIDSAITLNGYKGYDNAIIPLLEALGATPAAYTDGADTLALTLNALVGVINKLTTNDPAVANDGAIYTIIDMLPGILYYISSNGLSQGIDKLLTPVYAILDTIRPIFDIDLDELLAGIEVDLDKDGVKEPLGLDIKNITWNFIFSLLNDLLGLDLSALAQVIYDVCDDIETTYTSKSTLKTTWKKGAYNNNFSAADMLTVVLSFVLEWATIDNNAKALDKLLKTDGLIENIGKVFADIEIEYGTPTWYYWFDSEEEFNAYIAGNTDLPNTLAALTYPNDWNEETAQYIADELPELVDMVIALINKDKGEDAPKTLAALLNNLVYGDFNITVQEADAENGTEAVVINYLFSDETINALLGLLKGILANVDDALLGAGYILDVDVVGLKKYTCTKDITTIEGFFDELAYILSTYAKGLVDLLFFGDDFRIAKKSDKTDTIVINGGLGYAKGLAYILEALGCDAPAVVVGDNGAVNTEATVKAVLGALAARVTAILADPVEEVIDLLPNLVYFLNADGASVAVNNLLAPVYALLDKINSLGLLEKEIDLAELLGFDLKYLSLADILALVKDKTGLDLSAAEEILVNLCIGKIDQVEYGYKMTADRKDTITVILTTALMLVSDKDFAAKLDELLGQEIISSIKTVFKSTPVQYGTPNWDYCWDETDVDYVEGTIGVIESALTYPNDWSEAKAQYLADNLGNIVNTVVAMIDINGTKYATLADLIDANVNIYTPDLLKMIQKALGDLIGGLDADLQALVNVGLGAADKLLGADVKDLLAYDVSGVKDKKTFVAALTGMLMEVEGLVDWLLLGEDYKLFVDDKNNNGAYDAGEDIITLNGGHGYAEGLALVLEALGCQNLPTVYDKETIDTEATVKAVLTSLTDRIDAVLADPVNEAIDLLPNLIYFLNTNGVAVAVDNLLGAFNALVAKLEGFGLNLDLNALINIPKLMKIENKGATISLDNLAMKDILQAVSLMFGFDLTVLEGTLNGFALGEVAAYESVSREYVTYKMGYKDEFDKHDMITVLVTAILNVATAEGNEEAIKDLLGENADIYDTILKLISGAKITYSTPDWDYCLDEEGFKPGESTPVIESAIKYPNDWNKEAVQYLTDNLPALVDEVVKMISKDDEASLSKILTDNVNVFNADTLNSLVKTINELLSGIDAGLIEAAGILLDVKLVGENSLATYVAPKDVDTVEEFAAELAKVLTTYAGGVVEWLLLGKSYTFFVNDEDGEYTPGEDVITINGAHGYAEGLALLLEALGCTDLPAVYDAEGKTLKNLDTTAVVNGVLNSLAARITEIFANPVKEVINLLPNLLYFLNANGVAAVVDNLTAALTALLNELTVFGINLDINSLINIPELMGIADKYVEGDDVISLDNLTLKAILKAVSLMTGLDLTVLEAVLADFALGEVAEYNSVSAKAAYKMSYSDEFDKHHMVTVLLTSVLLAVFETEGNAEKLAEMLDTDIITAIEDVFNSVEIEYESINWDYIEKDADGKYMLAYPNNWNKNTATAVAELLKDKEIEALIAGLIDANYDSFSALLNDKVNVFTTANLQAVVDLITNLLAGINDGLLKAAGLLLDVKVAELKAYKAPEGITTVDAFAAELANVLTTYASGVIEWLLLGKDYRFFVKDVDANGVPVDFITINGAHGYAEGLALLLEALGCQNLPNVYTEELTTQQVIDRVLESVAARINEIFANPVAEVIELLPNIIYFLNTDGVAVVINNTVAAVQAVLDKLVSILGKEIKITELVDLADLMGVADKYTDADKVVDEKTNKNLVIALDNITIETLLKAVSYMIDGLDLTYIYDVLVGFNLGVVAPYATVSATEAGKAKEMTLDAADTVTIIANLLLLTVKDTDNAAFLEGLVGTEIYDMIMSLFNLKTKDPQDFDWLYKERLEDVDPENDIFSTLETSGVYDDWPLYGPHYTEEMATYIADNFGMFVDNILYLLGLEINGVQINDLTTLINELLDGSLYNSSNVIAIRDALAGVLASLADLEVNGKNVGKHIVAVLKAAEIADLEAVGEVEVEEFTESREKFVAAICDVLAPLYPVLKWLLADEDIAFFVDTDKSDLITLPGAEGYAFGIIPILEVLGCSMNEAEAKAKAEAKAEAMGVSVDKVKVSSWIIAPDAYYAMLDEDSVEYNPDILITSILDVLLDRVDEIIENPADEILGILPNLIYFINSNGLDTVFKNTLSAVYTILDAINPLVEIDLYKLIGIDLKKIDMNYLVEELLKLLAKTGYNFTADQLDPIAELTVGKLEKYTSVNGKTAYRMVYAPEVGAGGGSAELVTVILRLAVTFLMHEKNATLLVDFLSNNLGMSPDARNYLLGIIKSIAKVPTTTYIGMDQALAVIYYLFYSADIGAGSVAGGLKDINAEWGIILKELSVSDNPEEETIGSILKDLMDKYTGDVLEEDGVAPNGLIKFFQKIADWFNRIIEWFKNLFK